MTVTGDLTGELALVYNRQAFELARDLGVNSFLIDLRQSRNVDSQAKNYSFAKHKIKETEGIDLSARVAALVSPTDRSHNFIETVFRSSGLDVTLFRDRHQAIRHLEIEQPGAGR